MENKNLTKMSKYFKTNIGWVKEFCGKDRGVIIEILRNQPEITVTKEGGIYNLNTVPVSINPYKSDENNMKLRDVKITVHMPVQDSTNRIDMEEQVIIAAQAMVKSVLKRDMTEQEEKQLRDMFKCAF